MKRLAVIAITDNGYILGEKIANSFRGIDLLTIKNKDRWISHWENLQELVEDNFLKYDGLIFIMATGIVVRVIAKHLNNKSLDPAVVVVDEKGKNSISLISGHLGGSNTLTKELSVFLNNNPVITTATDVNDLYAIDSFARDYHLVPNPISGIKKINKAILEKKKIHLFLDEELIIEEEFDNFMFFSLKDYEKFKNIDGCNVVISNKDILQDENILFLRPKNLVIGAGCKKNFPSDIFELNVCHLFQQLGLSFKSIREIKSISIKSTEECILNFSSKFCIPFTTYTGEELNDVHNSYPNLMASDFVFKNTGAYGVAEPSSLIGESKMLLISSRKEMEGMTLAIAEERPFTIKKSSNLWLIGSDNL